MSDKQNNESEPDNAEAAGQPTQGDTRRTYAIPYWDTDKPFESLTLKEKEELFDKLVEDIGPAPDAPTPENPPPET